MNGIFATVLETLLSAVILIPTYWILNRALFRNFKKSIFYCILSLYLAAVYVLVGMPNITYVRFELTLNVIPIVGFAADWKNSILNVLQFVPLGIMLPLAWDKYRTKKETVLFGFGMSLAIEILQIFTFRATDINDLITNVLGTFLGVTFANVLLKNIPAIKGVFPEKKVNELYIVCSIVFAVMFFIHPFLSTVMWDMIY